MSKRKPSGQLPLHLPLEAASAREDLLVSDANAAAVHFLDSWPEWPAPIVILAGPTGAGKTHLAQIWAARSQANILPSLGSDDELPQQTYGNYVVEDIVQGNFSETRLFHIINMVKAGKGNLLLTSRRWPGDWGIVLPDLQSRMKLAHVVELNEPDDELLRGVLFKLFADRQMMVEMSVIEYCATRMERSLAFAQKLVEAIDQASLAEKRAITIPLASLALQTLGMQE